MVHRQAQRFRRDLRHNRVRSRANVGGGAADFESSVCRQHGFRTHRYIQRFPHAGRHAPTDELIAVAHRPRLWMAFRPAECFRTLPVTFAQFFTRKRFVFVLVSLGVIL